MGIFIGIVIMVAAIVGFMYINDISERKNYEETRKEIGEKMLKKEQQNKNH